MVEQTPSTQELKPSRKSWFTAAIPFTSSEISLLQHAPHHAYSSFLKQCADSGLSNPCWGISSHSHDCPVLYSLAAVCIVACERGHSCRPCL